MDKLFESIFSAVFNQNGLVGIMLVVMVWAFIIQPRLSKNKKDRIESDKKSNGTWVSWEELKNKQDRMSEHLKSLETRVADHLIKEEQEAVMFTEIKKDQEFMKERLDGLKEIFEKLEKNQSDCFTLIARIKDRLIDKR